MPQSNYLKPYSLFLILFFVVAAGPTPVIAAAPPERPNIVIIMADDLGWGDVGVYGQEIIATPRLDKMASQGVRFTNYYSAPWCGPARSALFEGKHLGHTYLRECTNMPIEVEIMPRFFQAAGYRTGMFGKWGFTTVDDQGRLVAGRPEEKGFDEFVGFLTHRDAHVSLLDSPEDPEKSTPEHPYYNDIRSHLYRIENGRTVPFHVAPDRYLQDEFVDQALAFIRRNREEPFFLYLPFTLPHAELYVPPDNEDENLLAQYLNPDGTSIFAETPWTGDDLYKRYQPMPRAIYAAMVSHLDRDVGRLLDLIQELGLDQRTLVIFTSDNGPHTAGGRTEGDIAFFQSAGTLRGHKFQLFEGGIRTPCLVRWPGVIAPESVSTEPVAVWDLFPTVADFAGVATPPGLDGISLRPLLLGQPQAGHHTLFWENWYDKKVGVGLRQGRYKLIRRHIDTDQEILLLFDLETDPGEEHDLARDPAYQGILGELITTMNSSRDDRNGDYPIPDLERGQQ